MFNETRRKLSSRSNSTRQWQQTSREECVHSTAQRYFSKSATGGVFRPITGQKEWRGWNLNHWKSDWYREIFFCLLYFLYPKGIQTFAPSCIDSVWVSCRLWLSSSCYTIWISKTPQVRTEGRLVWRHRRLWKTNKRSTSCIVEMSVKETCLLFWNQI